MEQFSEHCVSCGKRLQNAVYVDSIKWFERKGLNQANAHRLVYGIKIIPGENDERRQDDIERLKKELEKKYTLSGGLKYSDVFRLLKSEYIQSKIDKIDFRISDDVKKGGKENIVAKRHYSSFINISKLPKKENLELRDYRNAYIESMDDIFKILSRGRLCCKERIGVPKTRHLNLSIEPSIATIVDGKYIVRPKYLREIHQDKGKIIGSRFVIVDTLGDEDNVFGESETLSSLDVGRTKRPIISLAEESDISSDDSSSQVSWYTKKEPNVRGSPRLPVSRTLLSAKRPQSKRLSISSSEESDISSDDLSSQVSQKIKKEPNVMGSPRLPVSQTLLPAKRPQSKRSQRIPTTPSFQKR